MSYRLGKDMKLFYKVGGVEAPAPAAWLEMTNVRDLTLGLEADRADLSTRGSGGWRQEVATLRSGNIQFSMVWDDADAGFAAIRDAFLTSSIIGIQCLDGEETGSAGPPPIPDGQGLQSDMAVFNFTRNEELTEGVTVDVELGIAYGATPEWLPSGALLAGREGGDEGEAGTRKSKRRETERAGA